MCQIQCQADWDFAYNFPDLYVCGTNTGQWKPYDLVPDCISKSTSPFTDCTYCIKDAYLIVIMIRVIVQTTLFIKSLDTMTKFFIMVICLPRYLHSKGEVNHKLCKSVAFDTSTSICFGYLLELPQWGDSYKYPKHMFYEENKNKTMPFLHMILRIKVSLQQQIHFTRNIFGNIVVRRVHCKRAVMADANSNDSDRPLHVCDKYRTMKALRIRSGLYTCT